MYSVYTTEDEGHPVIYTLIADCRYHTDAMLIFDRVRRGYVICQGKMIARKRM